MDGQGGGVGALLIEILVPLSQERVEIVGAPKEPLPRLVQAAVANVKEVMKNV